MQKSEPTRIGEHREDPLFCMLIL